MGATGKKRIVLSELEDFQLGMLCVSPKSREVRSPSGSTTLEPRVMQVLVALHQAGEDLISRDELIDACWEGRIVGDNAVHRCIAQLRKLARETDSFSIQTIAKAGYRLRQSPPACLPRLALPPVHDRPSLAVLPFRLLPDRPEGLSFARGLDEALIAALSRIGSFFVISRNSSAMLASGNETIIDAGQRFGISYVVEGHLQRAGDRIRVTVDLCETADARVVWAETFEGFVDDYFALQDALVEGVAGQLQPSIQKTEIQRALRKRPQDLTAYDLTARALPGVWALEREKCAAASDLLEEALEMDADFALALALSGWCLAQQSVYNWTNDPGKASNAALRRAEKAAERTQDDPLVLAILGAIHSILHNLGSARVLIEQAIRLDPNNAFAFQRLGWLEVYCGKGLEGLAAFDRAIRLSPTDPMNFNCHAGKGSAFEIEGKFDEAVQEYRRALDERPSATWINRHLASALCAAGQESEARGALDRMREDYPDLSVASLRETLAYSQAMLDQTCIRLKHLGLPDR